MDIYQTIKPLIYISRIFCLAPFSVVQKSGAIKYKLSTFWILYSISGASASFVLQISVFWNKISLGGTLLYNATAEGITLITLLASITAQVLSIYNGKNIIRILDQMTLLDNECDGAHMRYCRLYKLFVVIIICIAISFLTPAIFSFVGTNTNSVENILIVSYYGTVFFLGNFIVWLTDLQFNHFVILLKCHFSLLNDAIRHNTAASLCRATSNHTIQPPIIACNTNSGRSASSNPLPCQSLATIESTLRKVCRHHSSLCDISQFINSTYSKHVLHFTGLAFFEIVYGLYIFLVSLSDPNFPNYFSTSKYYVTYWVIWSIILLAKVVFLVATCNYTSREVSTSTVC